MANTLPPPQNFTIAKGQDWPLEVTVFAPEKELKLAGDALLGATTIYVDWDHPALSDGEMFQFGDSVVVEIDGAVAAGATSVPVVEIEGPLQRGEKGVMLRDLTGATLEFEALEDGGDATPVVSKTSDDIILLTQSGRATRGHFQIDGLAADWTAVTPGSFPWYAWRRNSGSSRPVARGTITLENAGFGS